MISDEVRRRAVAELRKASTGAYRHVDALDVIANSIGVDIVCKFDYEVENETYAALADLIDRPTCKRVQMDATGRPPFYTGGIALNYVVGGCSECGYPFGNGNAIIGNPFSAPNYCPNCGARVVTDDD